MVFIFRPNTSEDEIYFLFVRIIGLFFCVLLMLNAHWQAELKSYFPFFIALRYNLVFFPTLHGLYHIRNNLSLLWLNNSLILFYFFVEKTIFLSVAPIYGFLGCLAYYSIKGCFTSIWKMGEIALVLLLVFAICRLFIDQKKKDDSKRIAQNQG